MNVCLNLSGKIILGDNETLLDKINHFKKYINFDKIYMHIWADDYIKYFNEIQFIKNCSIVCCGVPEHRILHSTFPTWNFIINNKYRI